MDLEDRGLMTPAGRRAGLKHQWSNPCRFDPGFGYQTKCKCLKSSTCIFLFAFCTTVTPQEVREFPDFFWVLSAFYRETALDTWKRRVSRAVSVCFCTWSIAIGEGRPIVPGTESGRNLRQEIILLPPTV